MKFKYLLSAFFMFLLSSTHSNAQDDDWRENMNNLVYSPRYFGPNAFPVPGHHSGIIKDDPEVELRGDYHRYAGDITKNLFARIFVPVAEGKAGFEVSYIIYEYYNMTPETVAERHAAGTSWKSGAHGDVVVSSFYQLLRSEKWVDLMIEATLKTASGNRLADARFTDAAGYWFTSQAGKNLFSSADQSASVRAKGSAGFYCWMTNDLVHRQNDALVYSLGLEGVYRDFLLSADLAGIRGYKENGDRPQQIRTKLSYEYRKNIISLGFKHGMKDNLYNTFSAGYTRRF
jgi:hypothetical protein